MKECMCVYVYERERERERERESVCVCVWMRVFLWKYLCLLPLKWTTTRNGQKIDKHSNIYIGIKMFILEYICMYICQTHANVFVYIYIYIYIYIYVCVCVCMCVCVCIIKDSGCIRAQKPSERYELYCSKGVCWTSHTFSSKQYVLNLDFFFLFDQSSNPS